jgi:hypothetical protein
MGFQDIEWAWNGFIWLRREIYLGFQKIERISLLPYDSLSFPSTLLRGNISVFVYNCLFVFLALQPIVVVFSQPSSGL